MIVHAGTPVKVTLWKEPDREWDGEIVAFCFRRLVPKSNGYGQYEAFEENILDTDRISPYSNPLMAILVKVDFHADYAKSLYPEDDKCCLADGTDLLSYRRIT